MYSLYSMHSVVAAKSVRNADPCRKRKNHVAFNAFSAVQQRASQMQIQETKIMLLSMHAVFATTCIHNADPGKGNPRYFQCIQCIATAYIRNAGPRNRKTHVTFNAFSALQQRASVMQIQETEKKKKKKKKKTRYFQYIQCIATTCIRNADPGNGKTTILSMHSMYCNSEHPKCRSRKRKNHDTFNAFGTLQQRASVMQIQEAEKTMILSMHSVHCIN